MKFLADENVDKPIVEHLRDDSHTVLYVSEMKPSISDDEVIRRAIQEHADQLAQNFTVITPGAIRIRKQDSW